MLTCNLHNCIGALSQFQLRKHSCMLKWVSGPVGLLSGGGVSYWFSLRTVPIVVIRAASHVWWVKGVYYREEEGLLVSPASEMQGASNLWGNMGPYGFCVL